VTERVADALAGQRRIGVPVQVANELAAVLAWLRGGRNVGTVPALRAFFTGRAISGPSFAKRTQPLPSGPGPPFERRREQLAALDALYAVSGSALAGSTTSTGSSSSSTPAYR
jgi:hypothetical protein